MKKRVFSIMGLSFLLAGFALVAAPAYAQKVEDKIKVLEQELSQLKAEQLELKKEATSAAAALPNFSYDAGNGVRIEAADKSWMLKLSHEVDWLMPFESGQSHAGRSNMEVMTRRFRQEWNLCINNCFYEVMSRLDLDGFNTNSNLQRAQGLIHFENINPFLPTIYFGADIEATGGQARAGSSATGAQAEYDLLSRNNGFNTGRTGTGVGIAYQNMNLSRIGIPGRARFNFVFGSVGADDDGAQRFSDKKDIAAYFDISPFSQVNNMWIKGFTFETTAWFCNSDRHVETTVTTATSQAISTTTGLLTAVRIDTTASTRPPAGVAGCQGLNIRDDGPGGRTSLFNTGLITGGLSTYFAPGIRWEIGPYNLRAYMGFMNYADEDSKNSQQVRTRFQESTSGTIAVTTATTFLGDVGRKHGRVFLIGHDIFLWSPKGFFTGSSNEPGSILFGTHFERTDVECDVRSGLRTIPDNTVCNRITHSSTVSQSEFKRNRIIRNEWDLWYFIAPRASVGVNILWYNASNLPTGFSSSAGFTNDVQKTLNAGGSCRNSFSPTAGSVTGAFSVLGGAGRVGCGGEWVDVFLRLRWSF